MCVCVYVCVRRQPAPRRSLLEHDHHGLSLPELQSGLLRLRESQTDLEGLKIQCLVHRLCHEAWAALWQSEAKISMALERQAKDVKDGILQQMQSTEAIFQEVLVESEWYLREKEELQRLVDTMHRLQDALRSLEQLESAESVEAEMCSKGTQTEKPCRLPTLPQIPGIRS